MDPVDIDKVDGCKTESPMERGHGHGGTGDSPQIPACSTGMIIATVWLRGGFLYLPEVNRYHYAHQPTAIEIQSDPTFSGKA